MDFRGFTSWVKYDMPVCMDATSESGLVAAVDCVLVGASNFFQKGFSCKRSIHWSSTVLFNAIAVAMRTIERFACIVCALCCHSQQDKEMTKLIEGC